jgi:hypothetical protein
MAARMSEVAPATRRRGGPPPALALFAILGLVAGVILIVVQTLAPSGPPVAVTPAPAGAAASATADRVIAVLASAQFEAQRTQRPYRPPETVSLSRAPREVLQAVLPTDPDHGFVVVYELPSEAEASDVGREYAAYIASGPGRIQFPTDTRFTLRRVGQTLLFFSWSPTNWPDPRSAELQSTLDTIGEAIPVAS